MSEDGYSDYFDEPNMEIQIDTLLGTSFDMRCTSTDTVREIKQRIQRVEGIPVHQQNLIFRSNELKDSRRLCDVGIRNGSTVKLVTSMKGGPISTRRLASSSQTSASISCEHHVMLKELRELLESSRTSSREDEPKSKSASGPKKVSVLVFKEGDILNLLRVIENDDGSYSPYEKPSQPQACINHNKTSESQAVFEKLVEDTDMMTKITDLRKRMEDVNIRRQLRARDGSDEDNESSVGYKLLGECSNDYVLDAIDLKIFEKNPIVAEETEIETETEEVALKDKHRIKPVTTRKSLFRENKAHSLTRQNYRRMIRNNKPSVLVQSSDEVVRNNGVHVTRLVLSEGEHSNNESSELEESTDLWEISEPASERLKHSATCKFGLVNKRRSSEASLDYGFDPTVNANSSELGLCSSGNFFMPQLVTPSAIPPQYTPKDCDYFYNRSPLYTRNNNKVESDSKDEDKLPELKSSSAIRRLKNSANESIFRDEEHLYGYYNLGCASELLNDSDNAGSDVTDSGASVAKVLPPVMAKKRARCGECNKRLNITNIYDCRCGKVFCSQHRYSEVHRCSYDYKSEGRRILEHQNPLVTADKVNRI